ncbi:MAG: GIY-YIG nuclease family protein [Planctomycetota bacterium]
MQIGDSITLYDLRNLPRSAESLLPLIPIDQGGVYTFFMPLEPDGIDSMAPAAIADAVADRIAMPRHSERIGRIAPGHEVKLRSQIELPKAKKLALAAHLQAPGFRSFLRTVMTFDYIFSAPLYIGKADNFRNRIRQHLDGSSGLRQELGDHGIALAGTKMLLLSVPGSETLLDAQGRQETESEDCVEANQLLEDVLSRLALPGFTKRIG